MFTTEALAGDDNNSCPIIIAIEEGTTGGEVFEDHSRAGSNSVMEIEEGTTVGEVLEDDSRAGSNDDYS